MEEQTGMYVYIVKTKPIRTYPIHRHTQEEKIFEKLLYDNCVDYEHTQSGQYPLVQRPSLGISSKTVLTTYPTHVDGVALHTWGYVIFYRYLTKGRGGGR